MQTSNSTILQEEAAQKTSQDGELMESDLHQLTDNQTVRRDDEEGQQWYIDYIFEGVRNACLMSLKLKNPPQ